MRKLLGFLLVLSLGLSVAASVGVEGLTVPFSLSTFALACLYAFLLRQRRQAKALPRIDTWEVWKLAGCAALAFGGLASLLSGEPTFGPVGALFIPYAAWDTWKHPVDRREQAHEAADLPKGHVEAVDR